MSLHQPFHGGDEVAIADGIGLPITHIGSASLQTAYKRLAVKDILCVLSVNKNLIFVYRLCNANQVYVEFFPASFQVKDLSTGIRLLQGRARDDLYEWPVSIPRHAVSYASSNSDTKATLSQWHQRLGHPSLSTLKAGVSQFSLPCFTNSS